MPCSFLGSIEMWFKVTVKAKWVQQIFFNISMASNRSHWLTSSLTIVLYEKFNISFVLDTSYDCQPSIYVKFYKIYLFGAFQFCCHQGAKVHGCRPYWSMNFFNIFMVCCPDVEEQTVLGNYHKTLRTNFRDVLVEKFSS